MRSGTSIRALPAGITNRVGRFRRAPIAPAYCAAPGIYTFAVDGYGLSPPRLRRPRPWWSRPVHTRCLLGCPGTPRQHAVSAARRGYGRPHRTAGSGMYRYHLIAAQGRKIEHISGLLICGFGVQVPGGAPVLTSGYTRSGSLVKAVSLAMFAPWLLVSPDVVDHGIRNAWRDPDRRLCTARHRGEGAGRGFVPWSASTEADTAGSARARPKPPRRPVWSCRYSAPWPEPGCCCSPTLTTCASMTGLPRSSRCSVRGAGRRPSRGPARRDTLNLLLAVVRCDCGCRGRRDRAPGRRAPGARVR